MKKQILKVVLTTALFILGVTACQKDAYIQNSTSKRVKDEKKYKTYSPEKINEVRLAFAKTLSSAIREEALRKYIHTLMQKRFINHDYEMVYITEKNKIVYDGKTFAQILTSFADSETLNKFGKDFFSSITDIVPLLTIAMPDAEKWDASTWNMNYVPNVAAVLEVSSPNKQDFTTFKNGSEFTIDLRSGEPDNPTLTVWNAETSYLVDSNGYTPTGNDINSVMPSGDPNETNLNDCETIYQDAINQLNAYDVTGDTYYLMAHNTLIELYNECLGNTVGTGGGAQPCTEPCERDCETWEEHLTDFKINDWGVYLNMRRNWFEDYFVFHGFVLGLERNSFGTIQGFTKKFVSTSYKKGDLLNCGNPCQGRYKTQNYFIRPDWNLAEFGDNYKINWSEVDDGSTTTGVSSPLSAKFTIGTGPTKVEVSAGLNFTYQKTIGPVVELGEQNVYYCHLVNRENNTGSITFRCD